MKVKVTIPKAGLRTRRLGVIQGVADGEYEITLVTTLVDEDGESVVKSRTFENVKQHQPLNPREAIVLATHETADGAVTVTIAAAISGAGYGKALKKAAATAGDLSKGIKTATALIPVLKEVGGVAATTLEVGQAVLDFLGSFVAGLSPRRTLLESRVIHPQDGLTQTVKTGTPRRGAAEPPSEHFVLEYDVTAS
ncbi:MAG: hypothetical protein JNJ54_06325 [Myxococcaceae bacterium]|nr:hypothetical protein [Myxococcaceae bacterium]